MYAKEAHVGRELSTVAKVPDETGNATTEEGGRRAATEKWKYKE